MSQEWIRFASFLGCSITFSCLATISPATAQIVPDNTLPVNSSVTPGCTRCTIGGGTARGVNLFHSFSEFSVPTGGEAFFNNDLQIQNIFSRVTGNSISNIDGLLRANGTANLFFLNPNGIIFGANASLDIGGSFVASTASSIKFADGTEFSAANPSASPLLTISVPIGLQYNGNEGDIVVKAGSNSATTVDESGDAGQLAGTAQTVNAAGTPPNTISGTLSDDNDVDLYQIFLPAGQPFQATSVGGSNVDTQLFLFDSNAIGLDTNDDSSGVIQSTVPLSQPFIPTASGIYYLGISSYNNDPLSASGLIFDYNSATPTGPGAGLPLAGWDNSGTDNGAYTISLNGSQSSTSRGLQVKPGKTLALIGGQVSLERAILTALGGRIELAGIAGSGIVGLNTNGNNLSVSVPESMTRANVSITNGAGLGVLADNGGSITINAQNLAILGNSSLVAGIEPGLGTDGSQAGDITLNAKGAISVEGSYIFNIVGSGAVGNGGDISITANSLSLTNYSVVSDDSFGRGNAGKVWVQVAEAALLTQGSTIYNTVQAGGIGNGGGITFIAGSASFLEGAELVADNTEAEGNVGNIKVQVRDHISFDGVDRNGFASGIFNVVRPGGRGNAGNIELTSGSLSLTNGGRLQSNTRGQGDAGNIILDVRDHIFLDGIDIPTGNGTSSGVYTTVATDGIGKGGDIYVTAGSLTATNGGQLTATTFEQGDAGNITIHVRDRALFDGGNMRGNSGAFTAVASGSLGQGGDILITGGSLFVRNGAALSAVTSSTENAGKITVTTREVVSLDGVGSDGSRSSISTAVLIPEAGGNANNIDITTDLLSVTNGAQLTASTVGEGKAGNIGVRANTLEVTNGGQLRTITAGKGDAGNINLVVQERVNLTGANSGLLANTTEGSTGNGGSIFLNDPRNVVIQDGARIAVDSNGTGVGGNIKIQAGSVTLENQAGLLAETASNTGGNITLQLQDLLLLRNNSKISTTAGTAQAGGDGGNITIDTDFIVAVPKEDSDITANAFQGRGGNINITATGIYGIDFRPRLTPLSDITASSDFGVDGVVDINTAGLDPVRGIVNLPAEPITREVAQDCQSSGGKRSGSFINTGRGGLPTNPYEPLGSNDMLADVQIPTQWTSDSASAASPSTSTQSTPERIVEAQAWIINENGEVVLVAEVPPTSSSWGCRLR